MKRPKLIRVAPKRVEFDVSEPLPNEEVFYYRVSTGRDQDPDFQIALAKKRGIPDDNIFGDIASGKRINRKGLMNALLLMQDRPGWTLVVWKLDRLGRDSYELLGLMREFQKNNWNLVSMTEGIDTRTPMGKAFYGMLAVFAQFESDSIAERSRAGIARRKEKGVLFGKRTKLTEENFEEIERLILKEIHLTLPQIAKRFDLSASAINHYFPGWRSKSREDREQWRRIHPLPIRPSEAEVQQDQQTPRSKRVIHRNKRRSKRKN